MLTLKTKLLIVVGVASILLLFGVWVRPYVWASYYTGQVVGKEVKRQSDTDIYLVQFKVDGEDNVRVFMNVDTLLRFKYNSGDIQANLIEGEKYELKTVGRRWHFPTNYQNIVDYEVVK